MAATCVTAVILAAAFGAAQQTHPEFRSGTNLVEVDAIVEDSRGDFVSDLSERDFEVLEDGKPQQIAAFSIVVSGQPAGRADDSAISPAVPSPSAPLQHGSTFIIVFDDEHLTAGGFKRVQAAATKFLTEEFQRNDLGGVVLKDVMVNGHLTSDREELLTAVRNLKPRSTNTFRRMDMRDWPRLRSDYEAIRIAAGDDAAKNGAVQRACGDEPDMCNRPGGRDQAEMMVLQKARQTAVAAETSANDTLHMLRALCDGLARFEGRKLMLLLSEGFITESAQQSLRQVVGLAARANVRIYAFDGRGLTRNERDFTGGSAPQPGADEYSSMLGSFDVESDAPNRLAPDTGGFVVRNTNTFAAAMARIGRDAANYYLIGYRPTNDKLDASFRTITVTVKSPALRVRARRGYIAAAR